MKCASLPDGPSVKASQRFEEAFISRGYKNETAAFKKHELSDYHERAVEMQLLPTQCGDIGEIMQKEMREDKEVNRKVLLTIFRSIRYLGSQGLPLRGHTNNEGNLFQLLKLQSETDSDLKAWLQKKHDKYTPGDIQNEILRLMAHSVLREIDSSINKNTYFTLMADEFTDSSNHEQFVVCLRWVDKETLQVHDDLIGLYQVDNITSKTLFLSLKDVLLRLNLNNHNCRGH